MSVYLDASVIVPHFIDEQSSEIVREWVNSLDAPAAVSALAVGEFSSALSRLTRTGEISREFAVERLTAIDEWLAESVQSIEIESVDIRLATVFVRRFELGLRMPDAIHLAACRRHNLSLATFDNRLAGAARFIGIATITPN